MSIFIRIFMGGRGRPPLRNEVYIAFGCRGGLSSADSVKSQNDCHRQSAIPTSREMLIKLCGYPYQNQNNFIEFIARSPVPSAAPGRQCKYFIFLILVTNVMCEKNIGFSKNEGCTRNFLGRGNAATQAMNFIPIKFEQAKRALTRGRRYNKYILYF